MTSINRNGIRGAVSPLRSRCAGALRSGCRTAARSAARWFVVETEDIDRKDREGGQTAEDPIIEARGVRKIYDMSELKVHAHKGG